MRWTGDVFQGGAPLGSFGVCVGALVRNQAVAIVGLLVLSFALEPAIAFVEPDVARFGPTNGAPAGIQELGDLEGVVDLLAPGIALLVMIGWVTLGSAAAAAVVRHRDLT